MVPMGQNNDEWVAAIASYVRKSFGNSRHARHARRRGARARRDEGSQQMWTRAELEASVPRVAIRDPRLEG